MAGGGMFEPSLGAYLGYLGAFAVRYFAIAGGLYALLYVALRQPSLAYRIQRRFPSWRDVAYEIRWSLLSAATTGLSTLLMYGLIRGGRSGVYLDAGEHGWAYLGGSVLLCVAGYDTWIYWQHRLLHTPWLFRHVHAAHHRVDNPTPFAAFSQHPIETLMGNAYFLLFVVLVPMHPLAIAASGGCMFFVSLIAHSGYEFYPRGFTRHPLFQWINTSTHHNMHHSHVGCHYGTWLNLWDRLMGTNHPAYHDTFDAVTTRAAAPVGGRERVAPAQRRAA
jgi:sterol desaturase/sphingolipid hydroxylase (fatty acid hydroxylase superfamily)